MCPVIFCSSFLLILSFFNVILIFSRRVLLLDLPRTCLRSMKVHLLNIMLVLLWIPMLCTFRYTIIIDLYISFRIFLYHFIWTFYSFCTFLIRLCFTFVFHFHSNPLRFKCWKKLLYFKDFVIWLEDLMKCTTRSSVQLQVLLIVLGKHLSLQTW